MKNILIIVLAFIFCNNLFAQNKEADKILEEGKLLYRMEKGAWYGSDHFMANFPNKIESYGGYVSYEGKGNKIFTTFFDKNNPGEILVRYEFDEIPGVEPIKIDTVQKNATQLEKDLHQLKKNAIETIRNDKDEFYVLYENTNYNFISLIKNKERKVFILTATNEDGSLLLGNDYLLEFDKKNVLKKQSKIHNSLIEIPYKSEDKNNQIESTYHTHILTDLISSTDICTLLLYKDFVEWDEHVVMSKNFVSIFNLNNGNLFVMKKADWDKIKSKD